MSSVKDKVAAFKCERLNETLSSLFEQYEAVSQQINLTLSSRDRVKLQKQLAEVSKQLDQTADQIEKLGCDQLGGGENESQLDNNRIYLDLKKKLPRINFRKLERILNALPGFFGEEDNCAAMLLFKESLTMGGELCAERIREQLRGRAGGVDPWPIKPSSGGRIDEIALLTGLAGHLGIKPQVQDMKAFSQEIVKKICGSLCSGRVVLIEFWGWDRLTHNSQLLRWVLNFWRDLVNSADAISAKKKYRGVKCIMLIFVDGILPCDYMDGNDCCTIDAFEKCKILDISLEPWTKDDIKKWMVYSGLPGPEIDLIAEKVYSNSRNGLPCVVEQELLKIEC